MFKNMKILNFLILNILSSGTIQCMELEAQHNAKQEQPLTNTNGSSLTSTNELLSISVGDSQEKKKPPKPHQVLELALEYLLYEFCDSTPYEKESWLPNGETKKFWTPEEEAARLRVFKEETANLAYSRSTSALEAFSKQPKREDLKNVLGPEVEQWLKKREKEIEDIKQAKVDLETWKIKKEGLHRSDSSIPSYYDQARLDRHVKAKEFAYNTLLLNFARKHGSKEVMLGERGPTETEKEFAHNVLLRSYSCKYCLKVMLDPTDAGIKGLIKFFDFDTTNPKTPIEFFTKPSTYSTLAVGTPYTKFEYTHSDCPKPDEGCVMITFGSAEVIGFTIPNDELPRRCEALERRLEVLQEEYNILSEVSHMYKNQFLPEAESWKDLLTPMKSKAETFRAKIKTEIEKKHPLPRRPKLFVNKEKMGTFKSGIKKLPTSFPTPSNDDLFSRAYQGLDKYELTTELNEINWTPKPWGNPESEVPFVKVTSRNYLNDEERYEIQMMWKDPSDHSLKTLGVNKIGLFLQGNNLSFKVEEFPVTHLNEYLPDIEVCRRLANAVEENVAPSPADRRTLLDFLYQNNYFLQKEEPFSIPKNAQMVTRFPALLNVMKHRTAWIEAGIFAEINTRPELKPTFARTVNYPLRYNELSDKFKTLLKGTLMKIGYVQLLHDMYQPYSTSKTSIPRGWKFAIAQTYSTLPAETTPESYLVPENCSHSIDLSNRSIKDSHIEIDSDGDVIYVKVPGQREVHKSLKPSTELCLSGNLLSGQNIQSINFSSNLIVYIDLSKNDLITIEFVAGLSALKFANLSNNKIVSLAPLIACMDLVTIIANNNNLSEVTLSTFPKGMVKVATLEIDCNNLIDSHDLSVFTPYFPNLKTFKNAYGYIQGDPQMKELM